MIKVNNPCPVNLNGLKQNGLLCTSCGTAVIDFTDKSTEEIIAHMSKGKVCGIFNADQVEVPRFTYKSKLLFTWLSVLSFLGFSVNPIFAQTDRKAKIESEQKQLQLKATPLQKDTTKSVSEKPKKKSKSKKTKYKTIGCPSF